MRITKFCRLPCPLSIVGRRKGLAWLHAQWPVVNRSLRRHGHTSQGPSAEDRSPALGGETRGAASAGGGCRFRAVPTSSNTA